MKDTILKEEQGISLVETWPLWKLERPMYLILSSSGVYLESFISLEVATQYFERCVAKLRLCEEVK